MMMKRARWWVLNTVFMVFIATFSMIGMLTRSVNSSLLGPEVNVSPSEAVVDREVTVQVIVKVGGSCGSCVEVRDVRAALIIPPNATRVSGPNPAYLGDISPGGPRTAYWVLVFSASGVFNLGVVASGYRQDNGVYEETYGETTLTVYTRLTVSIISPQNTTFLDDNIPLIFTLNEPTTWIGYSLDGQANTTITENTTLTGLTNGPHHVVVLANDTLGNMGVSNTINFIVQDTTAPTITILSPENKTYSTVNVFLTFTIDEPVSWLAYSLDDQLNVTINSNTTITDLSEGPHEISISATDMAGNTGNSTQQFFFEQRHDLAVESVTPPEIGCLPATAVGQGYSIDVYVTVENQGSFTETFNTTIYANMTIINTSTSIFLGSGNYTVITFTWNTVGWTKGNYTVSAYIWPVLGETDVSNNNFTGCHIIVTVPGDINGNCDVDIFDIVTITGVYGFEEGDPQYIANCDIDKDRDIDIFDVIIACGNYGESW